MLKLEVCCYSVDDALLAEEANVDRIELCSGRMDGGLTPSYGELIQAKEKIKIAVNPIVRPRSGDFYYTVGEVTTMKNDIALIRELGFSGVVFGLLEKNGQIDLVRLKQLMSISGELEVTFHRAFDMCCSPFLALQQLADLGVKRILTSGQQCTAEIGLPLIRQLVEKSTGPIIMAGSGIRLTNINKFIDAGVQEIHSSASRLLPSAMSYRKVGISMASESEANEFYRFSVDSDMIAAMKNCLLKHVTVAASPSTLDD